MVSFGMAKKRKLNFINKNMRGLLAIEPLYHQIIAGNKTQTRRSGGLAEVNDTSTEMNGHVRSPDDWNKGKLYRIQTDSGDVLLNQMFKSNRGDRSVICKPRYKIGEMLYLKEPIHTTHLVGVGETKTHTIYAFDYSQSDRKMFTWQNKLFMPASAARAFVKITGIKCERLLDISDEDCIAEGIEQPKPYNDIIWHYKDYHRKNDDYDGFVLQNLIEDAKRSFISLYEVANKIPFGTWPKQNPWVWAYTFEYLPNYKFNNKNI